MTFIHGVIGLWYRIPLIDCSI